MNIFCDMDEVLVDFTGGALREHGWTREAFEAKRPPGQWSIELTLGISHTQFWWPIRRQGSYFWETLGKLPWYHEMLDLLETRTASNGDSWFILTHPGVGSASYRGKINWLANDFKDRIDHCILTPHKHLLANIDAVLIDDKEDNVFRFMAAGGKGIIFPSRGNRFHGLASNPVPFVKSALEYIARFDRSSDYLIEELQRRQDALLIS